MRYDILALKKKEAIFTKEVRDHFVAFFKNHDYTKTNPDVILYNINTEDDANKVYYGTGLYLILTDYLSDSNDCTFVFNDLKAIYRGHCYTIKSRIKSHLFNPSYKLSDAGKATQYNVCLKLDGNNGINVLEDPYAKQHWQIVVHKMKNSSRMIREQAELAFDDVFSRPFGSKEVIK